MNRSMNKKWFRGVLIFAVIAVALEVLSYAGFFGSVVWHGPRDEKVVYLTFDDGPSANTLEVLKILRDNDVRAGFFLLGRNARRHPEIVKMIASEGHDVGVHSMSHPRLWINVSAEIEMSKSVVEEILNRSVFLFRPPYGFVTPLVSRVAEKNNLTIVMWDVFPYDYRRSRDEIADYVIEHVKQGSIIVLHDGPGNRSEMLASLPEIISAAKRKGYRFALLSEFLNGGNQ